MSSPAQAEPGKAVAIRDPELERFRQLGHWLALAETGDKSPAARGAAAALRFYYAEALDLPPMAASELSVIDGKLVVSALLLRGLAERAGYAVELDEELSDETTCTVTITRDHPFKVLGSRTFTIEDAQRAGLIRDRSAWKTYPRRMLWARASALVIRDYAPAVAVGLLTREELDEQPLGDVAGGPVENIEDADYEPLDDAAAFEAAQALAADSAADVPFGEGDEPVEPAADEGGDK